MESGQADSRHMGKGGDKRCRHTGRHMRAGRGEREVRRTGDRVHCAAASATYGRVAQPRHRGQGTRENPLPVLGRAAPHALSADAAPPARGSEGRGAAGIIVGPARPRGVNRLIKPLSNTPTHLAFLIRPVHLDGPPLPPSPAPLPGPRMLISGCLADDKLKGADEIQWCGSKLVRLTE